MTLTDEDVTARKPFTFFFKHSKFKVTPKLYFWISELLLNFNAESDKIMSGEDARVLISIGVLLLRSPDAVC